MNKSLRFFPLLLCFFGMAVAARAQQAIAGNSGTLMQNQALLFTENAGQVADVTGRLRPDILFTGHSKGAKVFIAANGIHYQFEQTILPEGYEADMRNTKDPVQQEALRKDIKTEMFRFSVSLEGANPTPGIRKEKENGAVENFYLAHCPQGISGVHAYGRVVLEAVYPGIDWIIYSNGNGLKYDFLVHPGADPSQIKLHVEDADGEIASDGGLYIRTPLGELREAAPVSFSGMQKVPTSFQKNAIGTISFKPGLYNKQQELIIDPGVTWATFYGGSNNDFGFSCATDSSGVYLVGYGSSTSGIASTGGFQTLLGGNNDAFIAKFNRSGVRQWATYYGGAGDENAISCALDGNGYLFLAGVTTSSTGMSTPGTHQAVGAGGSDVYLAKFDVNGLRQWCTYYGGPSTDYLNACTVDASGNAYLTGTTLSASGIASSGAHLDTFSGPGFSNDAFLAKFSGSGTRLWGTYYGGVGTEQGYGCCTDASGNVYMGGTTTSVSGIASPGSYQASFAGGSDAFLAKFNSGGVRQWGTYYGGSNTEAINACAYGGNGRIYVTGSTVSTSGVATPGTQQASNAGGYDAFLAAFDSTGARKWGTYYGGTGNDAGSACAVDSSGFIFVAGTTTSTSGIATPLAFQSTKGSLLLAKFDASGVRQWASYYGGPADKLWGCSVAGNDLYIAGTAAATSNVYTTGSHQPVIAGGSDAFLARLIPNEIVTDSIPASTTIFCAGDTIRVSYAAFGMFDTGNVFTAEISNATRVFTTHIAMGSTKGVAGAGTITAVIPINTPLGTFYRVRVVSSDPSVYSNDNGHDLNVIPAPVPPVITLSGGILSSNVAGVRWYGPNKLLIPNGTNQTYHPVVKGDYYAVVTGSNGCKASSNVITITGQMLGLNGISLEGLSIYPNPARGQIFIDRGNTLDRLTLSIYNPAGEKLLDNRLLSDPNDRIDISRYAAGLYFIEVRTAEGEVGRYKITVME